MNADGFDDVIIGAFYDDDNGTDAGSARVFSGADGSVLHAFDGDSAGDSFGFAVSGAGDVDGDGFDDVIVGALFGGSNGTKSGSARVFSGVDGSTLYTFDGDSPGDYFGASVSGAGDVNGDGLDDLIVGALVDDNDAVDSGSAKVFSGADGSTLYAWDGESAGDQFGFSVSDAGDVNGDGFDDLIVGAGYNNNEQYPGTVSVFSGVARAIRSTPGAIAPPTTPPSRRPSVAVRHVPTSSRITPSASGRRCSAPRTPITRSWPQEG